MDTMVKEKDVATEKAVAFESELSEYEKAASKYDKEVNDVQRKIAKVEDELDITISATKDTAEKLELADKEAVDAELQAGALKRRLALLEEEGARVKVSHHVKSSIIYFKFFDFPIFYCVFRYRNDFKKTLKNVSRSKHPARRTRTLAKPVKRGHLPLKKVSKTSKVS